MGSCLAKPQTNPAIVPYSSPQKKSTPQKKALPAQEQPRKPQEEVRLYGAEFCPFTSRIRIALEFKGVAAQVFWLNAEDEKVSSKQLLAYMLPDGKLPILQHADQTLSGSADDILDHIESTFSQPGLVLGASQAKYVMEWVVYVRDAFSPLILQALYKADPLCQQKTEAELHEAFKKLDSAIARHGPKGPYFMGDQFSLVDVYLIPFLLLAKPLSYFHGIDISPSYTDLVKYSKRMVSFSCYAPIRMDADLLEMHVARKLAQNGPPPLVGLTVLQHRSMLHHLEKLVHTIDELIMAAKQTARIVDPVKGSMAMQIRKVSASYGSLLDFMLEHAQMEERVIFPALEKADRGITKAANESHARDLPVMNGIREDLKAVLALDQGSRGRTEALQTASTRLRDLQEHTREHFLEEERELLPLLNAAGLGSKQQAALVGKCVSIMESLHTQAFPILLDGLRPHEIHQYLGLLQRCCSEDCKEVPLARMMYALKHSDEYEGIWCIVRERLPALASLA